MPQEISPNEFRSFIISNFRMFINNNTIGGRQEVADRIIKECDKIAKNPVKLRTIFSPALEDALEFVIIDFSANTNMMSPNIEREMLRVLDKLM